MTRPISGFITAPTEIAKGPAYMAVPSWVNIADKRWISLFDGTASLRHHYTLFFISQNKECQIRTAGQFLAELDNALSVKANRFDYTLAGLQFAKTTVESMSDEWMLRLAPITRNMEACDFGVKAIIQEGEEIVLRGGNDLRLMSMGELEEDFLFKHPSTEQAFFTYAFSAWNRRHLQVPQA